MNNARIHELSIRDELFEDFAAGFDGVLSGIVKNMNEKQADEAEISVKMTISLVQTQVPFPTDANLNGTRTALVPEIKHKIVSTIKINSEKKGETPSGYELIYDEVSRQFCLVKVSNGQTTIFDGDADWEPQQDSKESDRPKALTGGVLYLPDNTQDGGDRR